ncbi:MAG: hypothetical protein M3Y87_29550 [Myxococcota bacterium]|nr:hypothetical protein [Myxococcota bacterium]
MRSRGPNLLLHVALVIAMALAIGAPTPGRIGGCNADSSGVPPSEFCVEFQSRACARDRAAGRLDEAGYATCANNISTMCPGFNFPAACSPSQSTVSACYAALVDVSRLNQVATLSSPTLAECEAVCSGGSGGGIDPEGI